MKSAPVKLLFLASGLSLGGAEKQMLMFATGLARTGFRCRILTLRPVRAGGPWGRLRENAEGAGVEIVGTGTGIGYFGPIVAYIRILIAEEPTIVWTWGYRADCLHLLSRLLLPPIFTVVSLRSAFADKIHRFGWYWRLVDQRASLYIANSELNRRLLNEVVPNIRWKSKVIYNALEEHFLQATAIALPEYLQRLSVVMLGNVRIHAKGYDLVVELAVRIKKECLPVYIRIAGTEYEGVRLRQLIEQAQVQDIVTIEGPVGDPIKFLRQGHAFLLMSRYEGQPNALLEAMAMGLPCIATKVGDIVSFTHDRQDIRLIETEDVDGAFVILREFFEDWSAAKRLGEMARELCRRTFTLERMVREANDCLTPLLESAVSII